MSAENRVLSVKEAARIIFNTPQPTPEQILRVRDKLACGALKGSLRGDGATTAKIVAEYLAGAALAHRCAGDRLGRSRRRGPLMDGPEQRSRAHATRQLSGLYRELLKDYFLAVLTRRKLAHRSRAFIQAVLAGQVALLGVIAVAFFVTYRAVFLAPTPEQRAVAEWIAAEAGDFSVVEWFPPQPSDDADGIAVRIKYKYFEAGHKAIVTERVFLVHDNQVKSVANTD
jgi:hypothetical protein